jgi:hypothetical protein
LITIALAMSMKNAPTIGTTRKTRWEGPKRSVMAYMLAIAGGRSAEAKAAMPGGEHRRIVVATHHANSNEDGVDSHRESLPDRDRKTTTPRKTISAFPSVLRPARSTLCPMVAKKVSIRGA